MVKTRIFRFAAVAWLAAAQAAAAQTFDIATLDSPAGFTRESDGDHVAFTRTDTRAGTFCQIAVYASRPARDTIEKEFRAEWQQLAVQKQTTDIPRLEAGKSAKGVSWVSGEQQVTNASGMRFVSHLYVLKVDASLISVLANATTADVLRQCRPAVDAVIGSVSVPATSDTGRLRGAGIAGVWMIFKADFPRSTEPKPAWIVFFDDGHAFRALPNGGLLGFDRAAARIKLPNTVAIYTFSSGSGRVHVAGVDARFDIKLEAGSKGQILLDGVPYQRCADVDGLRLSGAWTSYANPDDASLDRQTVGVRPVFRFSKDGRFTDEGVFASFMRSGNPAADGAGSGSYGIKDFTLTLRYDDGRVKTLGFTGFMGLDPAADNKILYIERNPFNKRK